MSQPKYFALVALILSTAGCGPKRLSDDQPESVPAKTTAPAVQTSAIPAEKPSPPAIVSSVITNAPPSIVAADVAADVATPTNLGLGMPTVGSVLQGGALDPLLKTPLQIETNPALEPVGGVPIYQQLGVPGAIR